MPKRHYHKDLYPQNTTGGCGQGLPFIWPLCLSKTNLLHAVIRDFTPKLQDLTYGVTQSQKCHKKDGASFHGLWSFRSKNDEYSHVYTECLTLPYWSGYLNFCAWFIKNILFEQKKTKLRNKLHFVESPTRLPYLFRFWYHTQLDTPHSVGLFWMRDWLVAKTSTWERTTFTRDRQPAMPTDGLETAIVASTQPQTHALDSAATGIGCCLNI